MNILLKEEAFEAEDQSYNKNLSRLIKTIRSYKNFTNDAFLKEMPELLAAEKGLQSFDNRTGQGTINYITDIIKKLQQSEGDMFWNFLEMENEIKITNNGLAKKPCIKPCNSPLCKNKRAEHSEAIVPVEKH